MPKRIGNLYPKFATEANFILAERLVGRNKPDNRMARHISNNAESFGKDLFKEWCEGYVFSESRVVEIVDSYKGKHRTLQIPCLKDQGIQQAWLNIAAPYIEKRNYYYNCGSIPKAGQTRAVYALKQWLKNPKNKYGAITDIRKFYETCPHWLVIKGLKRMFKDKRFIAVAKKILASMSDTGIGLAIGHPTSHWFANVALMYIDHEMKRLFPSVKFTRYMDDVAFVSANKRTLKKCIEWFKATIKDAGMRLKKWQVFSVSKRGIHFLSYRFFERHTVLVKRLMIRMARRFIRASNNMNVHVARGIVSYIGILKHCNSYNFRKHFLYPNINPKNCRRIISNYDKNLLRIKTA